MSEIRWITIPANPTIKKGNDSEIINILVSNKKKIDIKKNTFLSLEVIQYRYINNNAIKGRNANKIILKENNSARTSIIVKENINPTIAFPCEKLNFLVSICINFIN